MKNTSVENPGSLDKLKISTGILKCYIPFPKLFLLGTLLSLSGLKKKVPREMPEELVRDNLLQVGLYMRLKKRFGQEKGFEIARLIITSIGFTMQQINFRSVEASRNLENLICYQQRTAAESSTRWNEMEVLEESSNRYELKVTKCMFYELFNVLGVPELTKCMCAVDNAVFSAYLPEALVFHRGGVGNRIVDGADDCQFVIEKRE